MAGETLKTASQLLADYGDNTSGLIDAVNVRNHVVSQALAIGFLEDTTPGFTIDIQPGVWTSINASITPAPAIAAYLWEIDGNQAWIPGYLTAGINVPAGIVRLVGLSTTIIVEKQGGGSEQYEYAYFQGGVQIGTETVRSHSATPDIVIQNEEFLYDVSLAQPIDLRVRGAGGLAAADLDVSDIRQRITGAIL